MLKGITPDDEREALMLESYNVIVDSTFYNHIIISYSLKNVACEETFKQHL